MYYVFGNNFHSCFTKTFSRFILNSIFCLSIQQTNAQCIADAGVDLHRCSSDSSIQLGGSPAASGGNAPYTYAWSIDPIPFIPPTFPLLYASDILDDTTLANPTLIYNSIGDSITFFLRVMDSSGCLSYDTCVLSTSNFGFHIHTWAYHINFGDSLYLNEVPNVGGGYGNSSFNWSPTYGLSDTNLATGFWAKPDSSVAYTVTVTDSKGCQKTGGGPTYYIYVNSVGIENGAILTTFKIFPNPATDIVYIESDANTTFEQIQLKDISGQIIKSASWKSQISLSNVSEGMYIIEVQAGSEIFRQRILKE